MLNRHKLAQEVGRLGAKLFHDIAPQISEAQKQWERICNDPTRAHSLTTLKSSLLTPTWQGSLADSFPVDSTFTNYAIVAVDGSQIYPDRHLAGVECFLINIGGCFFEYNKQSSVRFFSEPFLFLPEHFIEESDHQIPFSADLVDLKRGELEFVHAFEKVMEYQTNNSESLLCLFDGSLIFWHLEGKQQTIIDFFLPRYLMHLLKFYEKRILHAGYISMPRSKELINMVKISFCQEHISTTFPCTQTTCRCNAFPDLVDADLLAAFLKPFHRTTIFYNHATITSSYLPSLKPCFFYLNVGKEIVRIEIPTWIAQNQTYVNLIACLCLNQSVKGHGYPVALAEAHEQAVVKGFDRDFFYHMLKKEGFAHQKPLKHSLKSIKKMGMPI